MNELATITQRQLSEPERVALAIAKGGLFGTTDANAVLTLCYLAEAEGHHPAVVFRDYHIIQGKPAKKAEAILRDFISAGGKVEWHTLNDECADATFTHESGKARIDWTIERAKQAGINNPMWRKYPRQMLRSRVISEGVRTVFPGATSGLYEENEVRDFAPERDEPVVSEVVITHDEPTPSQRKEYEFPEGPAKNITELKKMQASLWREVEGCGDMSELEPLLAIEENRELFKQLSHLQNPSHRTLWDGDGEDNPGLKGLIQNKKAEFEQSEQNILAAG